MCVCCCSRYLRDCGLVLDDKWTKMKFINLRNHSFYSLNYGLSPPDALIEKGETVALTDLNSLSGAVEFYQSAQKKGVKPIFGLEQALMGGPTVLLLASTLAGFKNLLKIVSQSNKPENFKKEPQATHEILSNYSKGLICINGYRDSSIGAILFDGPYYGSDPWSLKQALKSDFKEDLIKESNLFRDIFGDRFYLGVDGDCELTADIMRETASELKLQTVGLFNCLYCEPEDDINHRVILANDLGVTIDKVPKGTNHFRGEDEVRKVLSEQEIAGAAQIADRCETFSILSKTLLPKFPVAEPNEQLRELCRAGWRNKIKGIISVEKEGEYVERIKHELEVFENAGLADYFLIVEDYIRYAESQGQLPGVGRGSVSGCLTAYLIGITSCDPIEYGLYFERFYNAGRNTKDRVALPDIDTDFPVSGRDSVIEYIRTKYGRDKVSQIVTFGRLQGRSALKAVIRAYGALSFEEINNLTRGIPDEQRIMGDLQEMEEETGDSSIIRWCLEHKPEDFEGLAQLEGNDIVGEYADYFKQAIALEGTLVNKSRHACGLVISSEPLDTVAPMILDERTGEMICGYDLSSGEAAGLVKFDVLGVAILDKIQMASEMVNAGIT